MAAAVGGGGGGGGNAASTPGALVVANPKQSPCTIRLILTDAERDPASVTFSYRLAGEQTEHALLGLAQNPVTLATSPEGTASDLAWNFTAEPGLSPTGGYVAGVTLLARVSGGTTQSTTVGLGNDAPVVYDVTPPPFEISGVVPVTFILRDSSDDPADVRVEFFVEQDPGAGWRTARTAGPPEQNPGPAFRAVVARAAGIPLTFFWDTNTPLGDLRGLERDVRLRFTATDGVGTSDPAISPVFRVDNNDVPVVTIDDGAIVEGDDRVRGVPVSYRTIDPEGDEVAVLFQWARENEMFPELGTSDPTTLQAWGRDPTYRRDKQLCTPYRHAVGGRPLLIGDTQVRLPELAQPDHAWLVRHGLAGFQLDFLRPPAMAPASLAAGWAANPLRRPIAALPAGEGLSAWVLDDLGTGYGAIAELELATGTVLRSVVTDLLGTPTALSFAGDGRSLLAATDAAGFWRLFEIDPEDGVAVQRQTAGAAGPPGPLKAIAARGARAAIATASDGVFAIDWIDEQNPRTAQLISGLAEPWGLAIDPRNPQRALVAERGYTGAGGAVGRVAYFDLSARTMSTVAPSGTENTFPRPSALVLQERGTRLAVLCRNPAGGDELRTLQFGAVSAGPTLLPLPTGTASIGAGPDFLVVAALPAGRDLAVTGGLAQRRTIVAYDGPTRTATLDRSLPPGALTHATWRLTAFDTLSTPRVSNRDGVPGLFVWDSRDVPGGGAVALRALVFDTEFGRETRTTGTVRLDHGFEPRPVTLPGRVGATADLDGDGALDLLVRSGGDLAIHLQSRTGGYASTPTWTVAAGAGAAVAVDDLNRDGRPDIAAAAGSDGLRLYFQTSTGFGDPPSRLLAGSASSVRIVDLDADGHSDLVSEGRLFYQVSPGAFSSPVAAPMLERFAAPVDIDSDGLVDFVDFIAFQEVEIVRQTSPGTFQSVQRLRGPGSSFLASALSVTDLDSDGLPDIVASWNTADPAEDVVLVYKQSPRGTFTSQRIGGLTQPGITNRVVGVVPADLNGDGRMDLMIAKAAEDSGLLFQGSGGRLDYRSAIVSANSVVDLNTDGRPDLLRVGAADSVVYQHTARATAGAPFRLGPPDEKPNVADVAVADIDPILHLDLVASNIDSALKSAYTLSYSQVTRARFGPQTIGGVYYPFSAISDLVGADLRGTGESTLVVATTPLFVGDGRLILGAQTIASMLFSGTESVVATDLDHDGDLDLATGNVGTDNVALFHQGADGTFSGPLTLGGPGVTEDCSSIAAADVDADGLVDLIAGTAGRIVIFLQRSDQTFANPPSRVVAVPGGRGTMIGDFNGDGRIDVATANASGTVAMCFQGPGATFPAVNVTIPGVGTLHQARDLDGNGLVDLVGSGANGYRIVYQVAPAAFTVASITSSEITATPRDVVIADLDLDGDPDIVSASPTFVTWRGR